MVTTLVMYIWHENNNNNSRPKEHWRYRWQAIFGSSGIKLYSEPKFRMRTQQQIKLLGDHSIITPSTWLYSDKYSILNTVFDFLIDKTLLNGTSICWLTWFESRLTLSHILNCLAHPPRTLALPFHGSLSRSRSLCLHCIYIVYLNSG